MRLLHHHATDMTPTWGQTLGFLAVLGTFILVQIPAGSLYAFSSVATGLKAAGFGHDVPVALMGAIGNVGTCEFEA